MLDLLAKGYYLTFFCALAALILSLSFHEFGHAWVAKLFGDRTAEMLGRLTVNPIKHIDPIGLLMLVMAGIGFAKPVPTNPRNYNSMWAQLGIAAAGPLANLLIAVLVLNAWQLGLNAHWSFLQNDNASVFLSILVQVNIVLMLFNLIPLGPLDGHYILPYFLPKKWARLYEEYNAKYGMQLMLGLFLLSIFNVPVFSWIFTATNQVVSMINFVG